MKPYTIEMIKKFGYDPKDWAYRIRVIVRRNEIYSNEETKGAEQIGEKQSKYKINNLKRGDEIRGDER